MKQNFINIQYKNNILEFPAGTSYSEIVKNLDPGDGLDVLLVRSDGRLRELHKKAGRSCTLEPVTAGSKIGMDTYKRSLNLLFLKSFYDVYGDLCGRLNGVKNTDEYRRDLAGVHVALRYSNGNGYFYTFRDEKAVSTGTAVLPEDLASAVKRRMTELVKRDIPIMKRAVSTVYAREFFHSVGMYDKESLFRYRRVSSVNLYSLENFQDYFYGYMVQSTGYLKYFDVTSYHGGLVLVLPDPENPESVRPFEPFPKIFSVQREAEIRAEQTGINSVGDLDDFITSGEIGHQILVSEALQESNIARIAADIRERGNVKFVMIAGPSSSGKTTFSRRLSIQLSAHGLVPHPISLDNFYLNRQDCPRDENGEYDFESINALDVPLIRKTLNDLILGKVTQLPRFDFLTGTREYKGDILKMGKDDILVIEGIHGLNPVLSEGVPPENIFRVYISALTQLNVDEHNHISTTDGRLIRRIVRDYRTRGTNARETIEMWPSVRKGEASYIFPNQENADVMFNSALIYELSVLKTYAEPLLFQVPEDAPEYDEAKRLLKFLDYFLGYPSENIPKNSILREFIGGSCFDV